MKWFLAKLVYRIICGDGTHTPQFDEQLRLISAANEEDAFSKADAIGRQEEDSFPNAKAQPVCWQFIAVSEIYSLSGLIDGAELYSSIREVEDAAAYITFVTGKGSAIKMASTHLPLSKPSSEPVAI
jgi:hypothetical protein